MCKRIAYLFIALATVAFTCSFASADSKTKSFVGLKYKDLPSLVKCDTRYIFDLSTDTIKRTMALTPAMADLKEAGAYTTVSVRLPFSGHMVHTLGLAPLSSQTIQTTSYDEHLEITLTRHNPRNPTNVTNVADPQLPAETSQAGLSSLYIAGTSIPNFYPEYFHEFLDVSKWKVEITCNGRRK